MAASSLLSLLLGVEHEDHYTMVCDDNEKYPFDRDVHHFTLPSCASSEDVLLDGQQEHYSRITFHYRSQTKKPRSGYHQTAQLPISKHYLNNPVNPRLLRGGRIQKTRTAAAEFYALLMHTLIMGGNLKCGTDGGLKFNRGPSGLFVILVESKINYMGCKAVGLLRNGKLYTIGTFWVVAMLGGS